MFDSIFGKKTSSAKGDYGKKDESIFKKGIKFVADNAQSVADAASGVADVSGAIASGAAAIGLEPVAAGLGAVAAGAKGVQGISTLVGKGASVAGTAAKGAMAADVAIDRARSGDIMGAVQAGKVAGAQFGAAKSGAGGLRKDIERRRKK